MSTTYSTAVNTSRMAARDSGGPIVVFSSLHTDKFETSNAQYSDGRGNGLPSGRYLERVIKAYGWLDPETPTGTYFLYFYGFGEYDTDPSYYTFSIPINHTEGEITKWDIDLGKNWVAPSQSGLSIFIFDQPRPTLPWPYESANGATGCFYVIGQLNEV